MALFHAAPKDKLVADLKKVMADVDELMRSVGSQAGGELQEHLGARLKDVRRQVEELEQPSSNRPVRPRGSRTSTCGNTRGRRSV